MQTTRTRRRAKTTRLRAALAITAAAGVGAALLASPAEAASAHQRAVVHAGGASYSKITVLDKKITKRYKNLAKPLSSCTVGTTGAHCSATANKSYANTWQTSLGLSAKALAVTLGLSYSASTGYSTTCQSPAMKKGQTWRMYPQGTRATYKIRKLTATQFRTKTTTSGTLATFKADRNSIYCAIR